MLERLVVTGQVWLYSGQRLSTLLDACRTAGVEISVSKLQGGWLVELV
jgi:hypothetical protein